MISHLSDVIDCLYDTYIHQTNRVKKYGYTREEAFWIHFASVSFMPWSEKDQNIVPLSHLMKFYHLIYNDEVMEGKDIKPKTFIRCLLWSKFNLTYALANRSAASELSLEFARDVGGCVFPHIDDIFKLALSGLVIINAKPIYQRIEQKSSLGRLVLDMDKEYYMKEAERSKYAAVL